MSWESLRTYAQAANDVSGIARARLLEVVREALRGEIERVGSSLGLAGAEEVAKLRRSVERLERRVAALEVATGTGSPPERPTRRASAARTRTPGAGSTRPAGVGGPARNRTAAAPHTEAPVTPPPSPQASGQEPAGTGGTAIPAHPDPAATATPPPGAPASRSPRPRVARAPAGTPVRRPRPSPGEGPAGHRPPAPAPAEQPDRRDDPGTAEDGSA